MIINLQHSYIVDYTFFRCYGPPRLDMFEFMLTYITRSSGMLYRIFLIGIITIFCCPHLSICMVEAFQCGPANVCLPALMPGCDSPIVPIAPCCEPTPLYPPAPPLVAPVIIAPAPLASAPICPPPFLDCGAYPSRPSKIRASN